MKAKPIILIIVTLIIGFILGMLTSAQIRLQKLKPVRLYFSEERFKDGFYKTIQPDVHQKEITDKIISKYAKINSQIQNNFRKEFEANFKAMRKELDSNLTKEQLLRVKELDERRMEMMKQHKYNRSPNDSSRFRNNREGPGQNPEGDMGPMPPPPHNYDSLDSEASPNSK